MVSSLSQNQLKSMHLRLTSNEIVKLITYELCALPSPFSPSPPTCILSFNIFELHKNGLVISECYTAGWGGGYVHTNWVRKLNFRMDNGFDLYFHNPKQLSRGGGTLDPLPRGGNHPRINKKNGSCDISNENSWKTIQICQLNVHLTPYLTVISS